MQILKQLGILLGVSLASLVIETILPFTFPSTVIGLLLMLGLLSFKWLQLEQIESLSDFLLGNLSFFFIPISARVLEYWGLISANLLPFLVVCFATMVVVYGATVWAVALTMRWMNKGGE